MTYSLSDGFLNGIKGLSKSEIRASVEKAFSVVAKYVPIDFVERADSGASGKVLLTRARNGEFTRAGNEPKLRFHRDTIDGNGGTLARAYFPAESVSIGGDMYFDNENWRPGLFVETVLHELGHALGLNHVGGVDAIMNPTIKNRFSGINAADLLADDIQTLRRAYGSGRGSVKPLGSSPKPPANPNNQSTLNGTRQNDRLIGSNSNQQLYGRQGNDNLQGKGGNDSLFGGPGSDTLDGGAGNDRLVGTWNGRGEKDVMRGGWGKDRFMLGNKGRSFYDDGKSSTTGTNDFAHVRDFNRSQGDVIQLSGNFKYRLGSVPQGAPNGRGLFIDKPGGQRDELIAVINGLGNQGLNSSAFEYA
ncbi:MAG: matrixin family metalloprotease [Synechococcus sp.]